MHKTKYRNISGVTLLTVFLSLIVLRVAAPAVFTWYANQMIDRTEAITGTVDDVDLALIAGAYTIKGVNIRQVGDEQELPLIIADRIEISVLWSALMRGKLVAEISIIRPTIGLYDRPEDKIIEDAAITNEKTWLGLARGLTPFAIDRLTVEDGNFIIDAQAQLKRTEFKIQNIQLLVTNIANSRGPGTIAKVNMTGDIQSQATMTVTAEFDPNTSKPTFDLNLEMERLPVSYINSLMEFYAPFDFEAGQIDLASELKAVEGKVTGYVQAGIYELDVFSWRKDVVEDGDNPIRLMLDLLGGALATLFESGEKDLIATRVSIQGELEDPDVSTFDALIGIFRNAFVKAYSLKLEDSVSGIQKLTEVKKDKGSS